MHDLIESTISSVTEKVQEAPSIISNPHQTDSDRRQKEFEKLFTVEKLRRTFKTLRKELRSHMIRDVVDWVDCFVELNDSLKLLRDQILSGNYIPRVPMRYELAKTKGAYRVITSLSISDALIYRHLADEVLFRAINSKVKGAFFSRRYSSTPVGRTFSSDDDPYLHFYPIWLKYNEYRSKTLLNSPYEIIVVTDIANYFDSIQHELLLEYLSPLGMPQKAIALLARLLEAFRPQSGHSPTPRVGLPTDELDCSRELAHVYLFEHDWRLVNQFGEDNYIRWMDDHNIGAHSTTQARKIINELTRSLSSQRLTLNSGKTKFLDQHHAIIHFQLDANEKLNQWEKKYKYEKSKNLAKVEFELLFNEIINSGTVNKGNWDKILKRLYGYAVRVNSTILENRCLSDLIDYPGLDKRIFEYLAMRNQCDLLLELYMEYTQQNENLFEITQATFFNSTLKLNPSSKQIEKLVNIAEDTIQVRGVYETIKSNSLGRASAILLLYWLDKPISDLFEFNEGRYLSKEIARTWLACASAQAPTNLTSLTKKLFGNPSDDLLHLYKFISAILDGSISSLGNYKSQQYRYPLSGYYYDARSWLILDLASNTKNVHLKKQLQKDLSCFKNVVRIQPERNILCRAEKRLS